MNRYETLASGLENAIKEGRLRPGDRLESVRGLSLAEKVSPSTVVQAYELLQSRGLIESRDRSGFFVAAPIGTSVPPQPEGKAKLLKEGESNLDPKELIRAIQAALHDPKILPLGGATPSPSFFPYKAVSASCARALREEPSLSSDYIFPPGLPELRAQIAARSRRLGVAVDADGVVTTAGALDAVCLALRSVAKPGQAVLLESPTYFGIVQAVRVLGYRILEVPANPVTGLEPDAFARAVERYGKDVAAAVLVPNHNNPTGACMPDEAKREMVKVAARMGVTLIEDDVYGDLSFEPVRPKPIKAFDDADRVILCGSFSKTVAPGLRTGFVVSPRYARDLAILRSSLSSGTNVISESTLAMYLASGRYERHLRWVNREYRTLLARFSAEVLRHFPEGTTITSPRGGYVLWVQLPPRYDSRVIQRRALESGISVAAGSLFSAQGAYGNYLRLNCAIPWSAQLERGIAKLGKLVRES